MFMHAMKKNVITNRNGVFTLRVLLGVEDRAVIALQILRTTSLQKAVTYGAKKLVQNPLENEARSNEDEDSDTYSGEDYQEHNSGCRYY
jgi:hypothetical protein